MPRDNRNKKPGGRRRKPIREVPGVKPFRKNLSEEEKMLNRRPRIKFNKEESASEEKPGKRVRPVRSSESYKGGQKKYSQIKRGPGKKRPENSAGLNDEIRLNRFIANSGVCSRREADKYIETGLVTVNGKIVTELGVKVKPQDVVKFDGRRLKAEAKVYILLNKPKNYVTTTEDSRADKTVMDLVKNACRERIYPVGRLDKNTTGLLLFTNDGTLSKRLTHPTHNNKKIYQASLDKPLTKNHLQEIANGFELEDGFIAPDAISFIDPDHKEEIGIEIHSGKNRIVRRIFEHVGYNVKKLDRVYFAGLTKKNLPRGKWRFLTQKEVNFLKMK
ncbi:MAG: rRNA pseudouridine synthase [Prolixibacteraceae bacterium]|nr:rRNA pseudouridine synthase [Prolixibacteraceae bacterium]MBN2774530.1 rRNA pseudouridine synthase [Prolixibacteraceae bacterium]